MWHINHSCYNKPQTWVIKYIPYHAHYAKNIHSIGKQIFLPEFFYLFVLLFPSVIEKKVRKKRNWLQVLWNWLDVICFPINELLFSVLKCECIWVNNACLHACKCAYANIAGGGCKLGWDDLFKLCFILKFLAFTEGCILFITVPFISTTLIVSFFLKFRYRPKISSIIFVYFFICFLLAEFLGLCSHVYNTAIWSHSTKKRVPVWSLNSFWW